MFSHIFPALSFSLAVIRSGKYSVASDARELETLTFELLRGRLRTRRFTLDRRKKIDVYQVLLLFTFLFVGLKVYLIMSYITLG